jgi:hypothetical protein
LRGIEELHLISGVMQQDRSEIAADPPGVCGDFGAVAVGKQRLPCVSKTVES